MWSARWDHFQSKMKDTDNIRHMIIQAQTLIDTTEKRIKILLTFQTWILEGRLQLWSGMTDSTFPNKKMGKPSKLLMKTMSISLRRLKMRFRNRLRTQNNSRKLSSKMYHLGISRLSLQSSLKKVLWLRTQHSSSMKWLRSKSRNKSQSELPVSWRKLATQSTFWNWNSSSKGAALFKSRRLRLLSSTA